MYPLNQNLPQYSHWRVQRWMNTDCARRLLRVTLKQKEMACTLSQFWDKTFFLWKTLNTCQFLHTLWFCVLNAGLFSFCLNVFFVYFFHLEAKSTESRTCCSNSDSVWTNQRHGEIFIINKVNIPSGKKSSLYAQSTVVLCQKLRPAWNVFFFFCTKFWYINLLSTPTLYLEGSKFTVANAQLATGSRTFAPKKNNLGANLFLQLLAHIHNKYWLFLLIVRPSLLLKFWTWEQNCSWEKNLISRAALLWQL